MTRASMVTLLMASNTTYEGSIFYPSAGLGLPVLWASVSSAVAAKIRQLPLQKVVATKCTFEAVKYVFLQMQACILPGQDT